MAVSYIEPAERAWARIRGMLFRPVEVERWIVVAFAAFLAGLAGDWAGITFTPRWRFGFPPDWDRLVEAPFENLLDALRGSTWLLWGIPFAIVALAIGLGLLWISSRGKFVFLDNMLRGRAAFVEPWKTNGRLGDSLFWWRLGFCVATLLVAGVFLWPLAALAHALNDTTFGRPFGILAGFGALSGALILGIVVGYIGLFLEAFVVPLMYARRLSATEAWRHFLPLLRARLPEFLAYGLVVLLACVAAFLCLIAAAIATCCLLALLLSVPYVRSVILLPLTGFYRLYSVEFLAQFGPEYSFSTVELRPEPPPPTRAGSNAPQPNAPAPENAPPRQDSPDTEPDEP